MGDFGTGLRAHLSQRALADVPDGAVAPPPRAPGSEPEALEAERRRLAACAAELATRELALAQREAELDQAHRRLALALADALIDAAAAADVPPPLDELALARARRSAS